MLALGVQTLYTPLPLLPLQGHSFFLTFRGQERERGEECKGGEKGVEISILTVPLTLTSPPPPPLPTSLPLPHEDNPKTREKKY